MVPDYFSQDGLQQTVFQSIWFSSCQAQDNGVEKEENEDVT